ncbi:1,4-alpha-glucan branching protein domain-containing protein [Paenibacillus sp. SI8]|uniref:1,4-alpha-glucan branching protein domain-containing protein n=1 Tax=unclassified Paenibacillus TaxID=185978 RepID=UPI0034679234
MIHLAQTKPESESFLVLVLHAHLPYFRQNGKIDDREERWLHETVTENFLPLLDTLNRLCEEQFDFRITLSITPTLLALLSNPLIQQRIRSHLDKLVELADKKEIRLKKNTGFRSLAELYVIRYRELRASYERCEGDIIGLLKKLQDAGYIEIVTSAATYGFLPLMKTEEAISAQIAAAVRDYELHFGCKPRGIWLPECGFTPGIDRILKPFGIDYFFVDQAAIDFAASRLNREWKGPLLTPYGVSAFPIDPEALRRESTYQEKYGQLPDEDSSRKPLIVSAIDLKSFGQGWHENPFLIEPLCRNMFHGQRTITMITPSDYLRSEPLTDMGLLNESSHGRNHVAESWLHDTNDWIYRHLHQAEERMIRLATRHKLLAPTKMSTRILKRALNQAARELMLAQSSDWAAIMSERTSADYAILRLKDHLGCFHLLCDGIEQEHVDEAVLADLEKTDHCFPDMNYQIYAAVTCHSPIPIIPNPTRWESILEETRHRPNVFMLSWEYPPKQVGGLSRAVHELSEALAAQGEIIHVITTSHPDAPAFEKLNGVYVHRLPIETSGDTHFYHWTFEMNLAMIDHLLRWKEHGGRIDLLHAHDWMVMHTAREIKLSLSIPLAATIHATEWGRNSGVLHTDLQRKIHQIEWKLTYEADCVYVCSAYMKNEIQRIFSLPHDKVRVYPNGIEMPSSKHRFVGRPPFLEKEDRVIFYIGRLVYEKGVQIIIDAMPAILSQVPNAALVIAGSGPMEQELRSKAASLGNRVRFTGFVDEAYRSQLYQAAEVCVIPSLYEPFGIVALEAMASRRPLVLSDTGGLAEIIRHGIDGYRALPGHVESLAWHVTELLLQPELAVKMANSAYQVVQQRYQWREIARSMQREYHTLTNYQEGSNEGCDYGRGARDEAASLDLPSP